LLNLSLTIADINPRNELCPLLRLQLSIPPGKTRRALSLQNTIKERLVMLQPDYLGLCKICANNAVCIFTRGMMRSVVYCEEFQLQMPYPGPSVQNGLSNPASNSPLDSSELSQGLCCDCETRHSCGLTGKSEGGIWYCEEYR
jgi:hypothetical protein